MVEQNTTNTPAKNTRGIGVIMIVIVLLALIGVGYAIAQFRQNSNLKTTSDATVTTAPSPISQSLMVTEDQKAMESQTSPTNDEVRVIKVEAGSFYYEPNVITVKKGEKVRIEMTAVDMMHNFVIDELDVNMPIIKSGEVATVEFTADTVGEFEYYCSVASHRANGQVGTLIVNE